ncbi:hypothetical protein ACFWMR_04850 [Amycolatopsis thailandensis]|uniref:hypothetical protein n=1 Tax=Amycolatopsis thailandensis TaxID=589330 RepID=UPI003654FBBC
MVTITTWEMDRWHAGVSAGAVTFGYAADDGEPNAAYHLPRVWPGRGLAISATALESFRAALVEVMKQPSCLRTDIRDDDGSELWSVPWLDPDEEFVFITGPCLYGDAAVGYRPAHAFMILLPHLRGLHARVATYFRAGPPGPESPGCGIPATSIRNRVAGENQAWMSGYERNRRAVHANGRLGHHSDRRADPALGGSSGA